MRGGWGDATVTARGGDDQNRAGTVTAMIAVASALAAALMAWLPANSADAQVEAAEQASPRDRQAAAEAYDRGTAAYLARDFAEAGHWFETAHRMAPAAPALIQAVRAYERAGRELRAATLALRLTLTYADNPQAVEVADPIIERARSRYVQVEIACDACTVELDGVLQSSQSFFVEPDDDHEVVAYFEQGERRESVNGAAGEHVELSFDAPGESIAGPARGSTPLAGELTFAGDTGTPPTDPEESGTGLSPVYFFVGLGLTAGAAGAAVWSGLDAMDGVAAYEEHPTPEALEQGQQKELRTNLLVGAGAALALATIGLALFGTDWGDGAADQDDDLSLSVTPNLAPGGVGGTVAMVGHFR